MYSMNIAEKAEKQLFHTMVPEVSSNSLKNWILQNSYAQKWEKKAQIMSRHIMIGASYFKN